MSRSRRYVRDLSPATIRNVMAVIEDMGYLSQPHTSAGRVPTDKAYRFYVDHLEQMRAPQGRQLDSYSGLPGVSVGSWRAVEVSGRSGSFSGFAATGPQASESGIAI